MTQRFITKKIHAYYIDYPIAAALMGLPFLLGLGDSHPLALCPSFGTGWPFLPPSFCGSPNPRSRKPATMCEFGFAPRTDCLSNKRWSERNDSGYLLTGAEYSVELIIEATGRTPNLSIFEGGHGEVDHSAKGVVVNEYLQSTSNPRV